MQRRIVPGQAEGGDPGLPTREEALALVDRYREPRLALRAFDLSRAHSRLVAQRFGGSYSLKGVNANCVIERSTVSVASGA